MVPEPTRIPERRTIAFFETHHLLESREMVSFPAVVLPPNNRVAVGWW
jgi:hypothetical protein